MSTEKEIVLALLGQPNSGKSTLFNQLTGMKQHVGNWPGKTVEKKEGIFTYNEQVYRVVDLPGSYSLSANSDEEIVTRDYIAAGQADLVIIMADASQAERSLYMMADFAGIAAPAILILNLMDVAGAMGKKIDAERLQKHIGIPVVPFVASDRKYYGRLYQIIERAVKAPALLDTSELEQIYKSEEQYMRVLRLMPENGIGSCSPMWLAVKCLEGDRVIWPIVNNRLKKDQQMALKSCTNDTAAYAAAVGNSKYRWLQKILADCVQEPENRAVLGSFDRLATSSVWGKPIAAGVILLAIFASMIVAYPVMTLGKLIPGLISGPLRVLLEWMKTAPLLVDLVSVLIPNILYFAVSMSGFVLGITFVFSFIEEVGYMARISFVFDNWMSGIGLQGKSVMPMFMGAGCTIGGAAGARVIDNWGQRLLTMALVWAVPCGATWSLMPALASMFFGRGAVFVMIGIIVFMFVFMAVTALLFGDTLAPVNERTGMIMELPPYHKVRWKYLFCHTLNRSWEIFSRAIRVIFLVSLLFWGLSYTGNGNIEQSLLYRIGIAIEPVTCIFGLRWQTFMAFAASILSKEAVLGVLSAIYTNTGSVFVNSVSKADYTAGLAEILPQVIGKPEALAFIFATTFNVPCIMAVAATQRESHSLKWTLIMVMYYTVMSLLLSCVVYHIGVLIF